MTFEEFQQIKSQFQQVLEKAMLKAAEENPEGLCELLGSTLGG